MKHVSWLIGAFAVLFLSAQPSLAEENLDINQIFIEKYKIRLTIDVHCFVDATHKHPNPAKKDSDMYVAGRAPEIDRATVAEIQNAKSARHAVSLDKNAEGSGNAVSLSGVWRIWPEHAGDKSHIQQTGAGSPYYEGFGPTNPPHVFEIYPVLKIGDNDLSVTLRPIERFAHKNTEHGFAEHERGAFEVTPSDYRMQMRMRMIEYNYVKSLMRLRKHFHLEQDGEFLSKDIYSPDEAEPLVHGRRIGFVAGTAPDEKQKSLKVDECMRVPGIPRVDLALVSWRVKRGGDVLRVRAKAEKLMQDLRPDTYKKAREAMRQARPRRHGRLERYFVSVVMELVRRGGCEIGPDTATRDPDL